MTQIMHVLSRFLVLLLLVGSYDAFCRGSGPNFDTDIQEIRKFGEWGIQLGKGALITPPRGTVSPKILQAQEYLQEIVEKLAGPQLRRKKARIVINIYSNEVPNAFVHCMGTGDYDSPPADWARKNPGQAWPIPRLYGQPPEDDFYEIGITTGLLNSLATEGELAFVLAHELTHLLEGHSKRDKDDDRFKQWWSSQSNEAVADGAGIRLMLFKYAVHGALMALKKIHPRKPRSEKNELDWIRAIKEGTSSHHNEGVRISMAQFNIEHLLHFQPQGVLREDKPLPSFVNINQSGRTRVKLTSTEQKQAFTNVIDKYFLNGLIYPYLADNDRDSWEGQKGFEDHLHSILGPLTEVNNASALRELFFLAMQHIEKSPASSAQKTNAMLLTLALFARHSQKYREMMNSLSQLDIFRLSEFFARHSAGSTGWTFASLKPHLGNLIFFSNSFSDRFVEGIFLGTANGQKVLDFLMKTNPAWQDFWSYLVDINNLRQNGVLKTTSVIQKATALDSWLDESKSRDRVLDKKYLLDIYRSLIRIPTLDFSLYTGPNGRGIKYIPHSLKQLVGICARLKMDDPGFGKYLERLIQENRKAVVDKSIETLLDSGKTIIEKFQELETLSVFMDEGIKLTQPEYVRLRDAFLPALRSTDEDSFDFERFDQFGAAYDLVAEMLRDSSLTNTDKNRLILLLKSTTFLERLASTKEKHSNLVNAFGSYLQSLPKAELIGLIKKQFSSVVEYANELEQRLPPADSPRGDGQASYAASIELNKEPRFKDFNFSKALEIYHNSTGLVLGMIVDWELATLLSGFNFPDMRDLVLQIAKDGARVRFLRAAGDRYKAYKGRSSPSLSNLSTEFLLGFIVDHFPEAKDFNEWYDTYTRIMSLNWSYVASENLAMKIQKIFESQLAKATPASRYLWFRHKSVCNSVSTEFLAQSLRDYLRGSMSRPRDRRLLASNFARITGELNLVKERPDVFGVFRAQVVTDYNVQPHELDQVFPGDQRSLTERAREFGSQIRGLSGMASLVRGQSAQDQLEMVEYLMGHKSKTPDFVTKLLARAMDSMLREEAPIAANMLPLSRRELMNASPLERAFVVNSFLAGPNGLLEQKDGLNAVLNHLLSFVAPEKREIARQMAEALCEAEGEGKSFFLAYALAQKTKVENERLSEALVIKSVLDAFGVPGIKFAQYLAFSSEFKEYEETLEEYQDAAMPLNDYDLMRLIQKRLGHKWDPNRYRIVDALGFGSVNVVVKYEDLRDGGFHALNISRDEIETKTREDFRRFRGFVAKLTAGPNHSRYAFVVGLMDIISRSVSLEFDKTHAVRMQRLAGTVYNRDVGGWKIRTVDPYVEKSMTIFMEMGRGVSGRKMLREKPAVYREAMRALLEVEYDILRGVRGNILQAGPLFANPDLHNGQVLIDESTKTATILDFGQSIEISNSERELAIDILRIVSGLETVESAARLIETHAMEMTGKPFVVNRGPLRDVFKRRERMDRFVHLASFLEQSGFKVPLSSIHWVLAANRVMVLGKNVGMNTKAMFTALLLSRKAGVGLDTYNSTHRGLRNCQAQLKGTLKGTPFLFLSTPRQDTPPVFK